MGDSTVKSFILVNGMCLFILASCAGLPGSSVKSYPTEYHTTVRASSDTLKELQIPVTETIADGLKTRFKARRPDGTPVVVEIVRMGERLTEVSVRAGQVGLWDKRVSTQINDFIRARLNGSLIEGAGPKIHVEELADSASQQAAGAAPATQAGGPTWNRSPEKVAEMLSESVFIIYFSQNSNALSDEAKGKLDRLVEIINNNPDAGITLNGYTDSYGARDYNDMISEVRANIVKEYLVGKGVNASRINTFGHGAQKFIGSNKTAAGRQMNRRVEIELSSVKTP